MDSLKPDYINAWQKNNLLLELIRRNIGLYPYTLTQESKLNESPVT